MKETERKHHGNYKQTINLFYWMEIINKETKSIRELAQALLGEREQGGQKQSQDCKRVGRMHYGWSAKQIWITCKNELPRKTPVGNITNSQLSSLFGYYYDKSLAIKQLTSRHRDIPN